MKNLCNCNIILIKEVKNFLENVENVKEESITDYLAWRWSILDKRFSYIKYDMHSRKKESKTGVDFDLWLVGRKKTINLAIQAKKFIKTYDNYSLKIKYPNKTSKQITALIKYAKLHKKIPLYFIYSVINTATITKCNLHDKDAGVFVVEAENLKILSQQKKLSLHEILKDSYPFSCYFCHDIFLNNSIKEEYLLETDQLPPGIFSLLNGNSRADISFENENQETSCNKIKSRIIGIYDLRKEDIEFLS